MGNSQHATQLVRGDFHGAWRWCRSRCRLWECSGQSRVERDVAFHLLHDLMNVAVQNGDGTEALQVSECLLAVIRAPAPFGIDRPERDVREHDHRSAAIEV